MLPTLENVRNPTTRVQVEPYYWEEGGNPNVDWWAKVRHSLHFGGVKAVEGAEAIGEVRGGPVVPTRRGGRRLGCLLVGAMGRGMDAYASLPLPQDISNARGLHPAFSIPSRRPRKPRRGSLCSKSLRLLRRIVLVF